MHPTASTPVPDVIGGGIGVGIGGGVGGFEMCGGGDDRAAEEEEGERR